VCVYVRAKNVADTIYISFYVPLVHPKVCFLCGVFFLYGLACSVFSCWTCVCVYTNVRVANASAKMYNPLYVRLGHVKVSFLCDVCCFLCDVYFLCGFCMCLCVRITPYLSGVGFA